jgi:hypothetical protein
VECGTEDEMTSPNCRLGLALSSGFLQLGSGRQFI